MNQVVHVETHSAAAIDAVWALLAEVESWPQWSAFEEAGLEREGSPDRQGLGAVRRFKYRRTRSRETVVAFEPPRHLAYTVLSGVPVRGYRADVTLAGTPDGGTLITWHSEFRAKIPGTGGLVRRSLTSFIRQLSADLARAATAPTPADPAPAAPGPADPAPADPAAALPHPPAQPEPSLPTSPPASPIRGS